MDWKHSYSRKKMCYLSRSQGHKHLANSNTYFIAQIPDLFNLLSLNRLNIHVSLSWQFLPNPHKRCVNFTLFGKVGCYKNTRKLFRKKEIFHRHLKSQGQSPFPSSLQLFGGQLPLFSKQDNPKVYTMWLPAINCTDGSASVRWENWFTAKICLNSSEHRQQVQEQRDPDIHPVHPSPSTWILDLIQLLCDVCVSFLVAWVRPRCANHKPTTQQETDVTMCTAHGEAH